LLGSTLLMIPRWSCEAGVSAVCMRLLRIRRKKY
jgi:hypothetical protein